MLWGFFVTDRERTKLERVIPSLETKRFRYVEIFGSDPDHPDPDDPQPDIILYLHVEIEALHTPASLFKACGALDDFALEYELTSFDGFDVGNVDGSGLFPG